MLRASILSHMKLHKYSVGEADYTCSKCNKKYCSESSLKRHICDPRRKRWKEKDFRITDLRLCIFCDTRFANKDEKEAHSCKFQDPNNPNFVSCRCCNKNVSKVLFKRHMALHNGEWTCEICNKKFVAEKALKIHHTTHTGERPHQCKSCPKRFLKKEALDVHMRYHGQPKPGRTFHCEICFKGVTSKRSLNRHLLIHKRNPINFICYICDKNFISNDKLVNHMRAGHSSKKKVEVSCEVCHRTFASSYSLKCKKTLIYKKRLFLSYLSTSYKNDKEANVCFLFYSPHDNSHRR